MQKSKIFAILAIGCAVTATVFAYLYYISDNSAYVSAQEPVAETVTASAQTMETTETPSQTTSTETMTESAQSPDYGIDFTALQAQNEDVYAWITIPDTNISYPVCNRAADNAFYLDHDLDGAYSAEGTLFTENYNSTTFGDPATVIYGHNMASGAMFGYLQEYYSNPEFFETHQQIVVTLPDAQKTYEIFAAVPYSNAHLLFAYDFSTSQGFMAFLESVYSIRSLEAVIDSSISVGSAEQLLILSTCLRGDHDGRFLVIAVETTE